MAEIPVQKKSSSSWIWILLALLVVGLLIWWLLSEADDDEALIADDVETAQLADTDANAMAAGTTGAITSLAMLGTGGDMIGREVMLDNVAVTEVIGDQAFTVGEAGNEVLVTFNQVPTPDTPTEGRIDVNPGSRVSIEGTVREYRGNVPTSVSEEVGEDLTSFIDATNVTMMN